MKVFVLNTDRNPMNPVHPAEARLLLSQRKAAVFRRFPFTIILKESAKEKPESLRLKIDPGSRTTGIAIVSDNTGEIIFAAGLNHRGQRIKGLLESRRSIRRSRRNRKTRYRKPRFQNRTRPENWLPPSLKSRVHNTETWVHRFRRFCNIRAISTELVRFDTQLMENPEISGAEYQQGELAGYEVREYLLEKWERRCAYCGKQNIPLEIEHIVPKSGGGSDRVSNLTLACNACNTKKGNKPVREFLKRKPGVLKKILAQARTPLKDAAAVNATRWDLYHTLKKTGLPVETGSGGLTKFNRVRRGMDKTHWSDAACVGKSTPVSLFQVHKSVLGITATGHGSRQMCRADRYGFPRTKAKPRQKGVRGFQTGDMVRAVVPTGKKAGVYEGRVAVRTSGNFNIKTDTGTVQGIGWKRCRILHRSDGYSYAHI